MSKEENKLKVVIDTSVYIQYILGLEGSACHIIFSMWKQSQLTVIISPAIISELKTVLDYGRIKKVINSDHFLLQAKDDLLLAIKDRTLTKLVPGLYEVVMVKTDPRDNMFLATAIEGQADYILSVDEGDLLSLKQLPKPYQKIKIISPADFLKIMIKL